ncbi:MAG: hypothetical protein EOO42_24270 [Flavobacteriales bacterium]|nr:MAG: hypothetical protein EOO42_24270 [Flavobacteriales bacterium]
MMVQEYLMNTPIALKYIAGLMWPNNKGAEIYLSKKLKGDRPFTSKDQELAIEALREIANDLTKIDGFELSE